MNDWSPYIPDVTQWQQSALQGYNLGSAMKQRQEQLAQNEANKLAAAALAKGDIRGSQNALASVGNMDAVLKLRQMQQSEANAALARQNAATEQRAKTFQALGNMVRAIQTPEEFARALTAARTIYGNAVDKYKFEDLPTLKAQFLDEERKYGLQQRQMAATENAAKNRYISTSGGLYDTETKSWVSPSQAAAEYGLNPIYGVDDKGQPVIMQLSKAGTLNRPSAPAGVTITKPPRVIDTGTEFQTLNPITQQIEKTIPKDVQGKLAAEARGKVQGQTQSIYDTAITSANSAFATIDKLRNHPGLNAGTGLTSYLPSVRDASRNFDILNQQAQSQTFMQAREALKGAGQVTDFEGKKGEQSIARLSQAQSKEEYLNALSDLEKLMQNSVVDLHNKASGKFMSRDVPVNIIDLSQDDGTKYRTLPSGTQFRAPDGKIRIKP